jgi:hypothetical protein
MPATIIGQIRTEVVLSHTPPNTTAALIVPADTQGDVDRQMRMLVHRGLDHRFTAAHPATGEQTVAFMPLPPGRVRMLRERGIVHGEHFLASFAVNEKPYRGQLRREMWLTNGNRLGQPVA